MKVTIIGLGLIGGSVAIDLKKRGFASHIMGVDNNALHAHTALKLSLVDQIVPFEKGIDDSDLIIMAIPVDATTRLLPQILDRVNHQIITDLGSTKEEMILTVSTHPKRGQYVAAHPMAGTEFSGPQAAHSGLFDGKCSIICNPHQSSKEAVGIVKEMFQTLNMRCIEMDAKVHDAQTAYVSHLSHISAFALSLTVLQKEKKDKHIFELASGGFDSTVRLAKSSAYMWTPILHQNKKNISKILQKYIDCLSQFKDMIDEDNLEGIHQLIDQSNDIRRVLEDKEKKEKETLLKSMRLVRGA